MNDLISRQAAIDAKQEFRNPNVVRNTEARTAYDRTYANGWNDCNSAWINAIKALPSVQPETAKRIVGKSRDGMTMWYQCDMCNEPVDEKDTFCSGCGRRFANE